MSSLAACKRKIAAKAPAAARPTQATHLGVPKSKAESATRVQPTVSITCIARLEPLPNSTWINTATGNANTRTIDPTNPRGDRILRRPNVSRWPATFGVVSNPAGRTLRGCSVIPRTSSIPPLREGFARQIEPYGTGGGGTPVELLVRATGFSNDAR